MTIARFAVLLLLVTCRSDTRVVTPPPVITPPPVASAKTDPELVRTLAILATRHAPEPAVLADTVAKLDRHELAMAGYIDTLVATKEFAADVAPLLVLRQLLSQNALAAPSGFVLKATQDPDPILYLHEPCKPAAAVRVHPWWSMDAEVRVCPDSYRPSQWTSPRAAGEPEMSCLSLYAPGQTAGQTCGCGPSLIRCFRSAEQQIEVQSSLRDELRGTIQYVTEHDLPIEQVFLANETFRDRNAELVRRAQLIELHRDEHPDAMLRELATWPKAGAWAPRTEVATGQHAGILTSPHIVFFLPDRRQRMTTVFDALWCVEPDSVGATPEGMLSIAGANLQLKSTGWQELAARPICTNCHARLDYGLQFFNGFPNANLQAFFNPAQQQPGRGKFFAGNIDDPRGDGELTPVSFAKLAVAQPEFRHCMARDFTEYVLGNEVAADQISTVEASIKPTANSPRALMRVALARLVASWVVRPPPDVNLVSTAARPAPSTITLTSAVAKRISDACSTCHDAEPGRLDLSVTTLPRASVVAMLDNVAFGRMPKDDPIPVAERAVLLEGLIDLVWTGTDNVAARSYYIGRMASLPAFRPEVVFDIIEQRAHARSPAHWRMMENAVRSNIQQVTTGLATLSGLAAIEACRARWKERAQIDACIADTVRLDALTIRR
ncbi:MAG: hypothetical protein ABI867_06620 [Kofleriaceae bacterium]